MAGDRGRALCARKSLTAIRRRRVAVGVDATRRLLHAAAEAAELGRDRVELRAHLVELRDDWIFAVAAAVGLSLGHKGGRDHAGHDREQRQPAEHQDGGVHVTFEIVAFFPTKR